MQNQASNTCFVLKYSSYIQKTQKELTIVVIFGSLYTPKNDTNDSLYYHPNQSQEVLQSLQTHKYHRQNPLIIKF
jgi:hypothetical protein